MALLDWLLLERRYIGETGEPNDTCRATKLAPAPKDPLHSTRYLLLVDTVLKTLLSVACPVLSVWLLPIARSQRQQLLVSFGTTVVLHLCLTLPTTGEGLEVLIGTILGALL